jgi:AraC family transcriptional regulator, positive regulator of tynA and feaB
LKKPHLAMATAVGKDSGIGYLTVDFLTSVAHNVEKFSSDSARVGANVVDLIAMSLGPAMGNQEERRGVVRKELCTAILNFVDANIADPELSPTKVAAHFRISPRYLHKLLEESGKSFGRVVLERRLERSATDILAAGPHTAISEVAYRWGFNDLSHFSRTFRQRYGCSPSEFRHQMPAGSTTGSGLIITG